MYQVLTQDYGSDTPKGTTLKTTEELKTFLGKLEVKSLVYLEVRYVRSIPVAGISKE